MKRLAPVQMPSQKLSTIYFGSYPRFDPGCGRLSVSNLTRIPTCSINRFIKLIPPNGVTGLEEYSIGRLTILVLLFILQKPTIQQNLTTSGLKRKSHRMIEDKIIF
jgi:hypothetical protein